MHTCTHEAVDYLIPCNRTCKHASREGEVTVIPAIESGTIVPIMQLPAVRVGPTGTFVYAYDSLTAATMLVVV